MKIRVIKGGNLALHPSLPEDEDIVRKWPTGDILEVEIKRPRNARFHRKYWALIGMAYQNQEEFENKEHFRMAVQIAAGHCETFLDLDGNVTHRPRSIAFESCDEDQFAVVYDEVLTVVIGRVMTGSTPDEIGRALDDYLGFM